MKKVLITLLAAVLTGAASATLLLWRGWYDISATGGHLQPVYDLLHLGMKRSVGFRAASVEVPALGAPEQVARGAACYRDHCEQCHGGPGVSPSAIGMSLEPLPGPLMDAAQHWKPAELYWITRQGIKMTGMPGWELRLSDADLWAVTAFLQHLPSLTPHAYREAAQPGACPSASQACQAGACPEAPTADLAPLQPRSRDDAAQLALRQYACVACHRIPGVTGPQTDVGPPLSAWRRRERIAGRLPNTADALVRFIRDPQGVDPGTAMPDLGVTEPHARLMAEYLLKQD